MPRNLYMKYYIAGILLIIFDQITKYLIRAQLSVGESVRLLGDFFRLTYVQNTGAAFSILTGQRVFLIALPVIVIAGVLFYLHRYSNKHPMLCIAGALLISGGIGNLIDRAYFGFVTDMLDFSIFPPVFNVADICVCVGCGFLVLYVLFEDKLNKIGDIDVNRK